jgi:hypothetical protein
LVEVTFTFTFDVHRREQQYLGCSNTQIYKTQIQESYFPRVTWSNIKANKT